jgi:hypothetical protein
MKPVFVLVTAHDTSDGHVHVKVTRREVRRGEEWRGEERSGEERSGEEKRGICCTVVGKRNVS